MAKSLAIGIDLGTTYSCVGVWRNGRVEIIPNDQGNRITPSFVAFSGNDRLTGDAAKNQAAINVHNTVFDAKRLIGRWFTDETVQSDMKLWPFKVVADACNQPMIVVQFEGKERKFAPQEISSMVLVKMKEIAGAYLGCEVKSAVLTVPAYFNDAQRQATRDAGTMAGLDVLRIINEPTAAAIAYGLDMRGAPLFGHDVLIFDLGGGTLDVSLLRIRNGIIEVKATAGDTHLGGEDFDNILVDHLVVEFSRKHGKNMGADPRMLRRMRSACERAKRVLSFSTHATIEIDLFLEDCNYNISRAKFEDLCMDLFNKCLEPVEKCLRDSLTDKKQVQEIVLVGGSTRIPKIQQLLKDFFQGKEPNQTINCDEAVAYGAAVQAAILNGEGNQKVKGLILRDVTPLSLGVELNGGIMSIVIPRNTTIPTQKSRNYTTSYHNQTEVAFPIYEGERARSKRNNWLGSFILHGIPPSPRGVPSFVVTFAIDANGILSISAAHHASGAKNKIIVSKEKRITKEHIGNILEEAEKFEDEDEEVNVHVKALKKQVDMMIDTYNNELDKKLRNAAEDTLQWLDDVEVVSVAEVKNKLTELRKLTSEPLVA